MGNWGKPGAIFIYSVAGICAILIVDKMGDFGIFNSIANNTIDTVNKLKTDAIVENDYRGHVVPTDSNTGGSATKRRKKHKNKSHKKHKNKSHKKH